MDPLPIPEPPPPTPFEPALVPSPKKPFPVIGIFIAFLFLILLGLLMYQQLQIRTLLTSKPPAVITETPTPTPNPTADWKTYAYDEYGYSFKYPSEYSVQERAPGFLVIVAPDEPVAQAGISIESRLMGPNENYDNAKNVITSTNTISETTTVGSWEIFQGMGNDGMLKGVEFRFGIAPYKTGAIEAETLANAQYINVFDQILSTFQFTN